MSFQDDIYREAAHEYDPDPDPDWPTEAELADAPPAIIPPSTVDLSEIEEGDDIPF